MVLMGGRVSVYATTGMWRPEGANLFVPTWRTCSQKLQKPYLMGYVAFWYLMERGLLVSDGAWPIGVTVEW